MHMVNEKECTSFKSGNVPSCKPWLPINSYPLLLAPTLLLLSSFFFSSRGKLKKASAALKTSSRTERGMPWPTSWKKPVVRQAARTCSTISSASGDVGERRYGAMSTRGMLKVHAEGESVEMAILLVVAWSWAAGAEGRTSFILSSRCLDRVNSLLAFNSLNASGWSYQQ